MWHRCKSHTVSAYDYSCLTSVALNPKSSEQQMMILFKEPGLHFLFQTLDFSFACLLLFVCHSSILDCSWNIQEIFVQAASPGVCARRHDSSPKQSQSQAGVRVTLGCSGFNIQQNCL